MPALVVFDCFDTLVLSRPLPGADHFTACLTDVLALDSRQAEAVVRTVFDAILTALADPCAPQPPTLDLLDTALRERGEPRDSADLEETLWQALGCADPDQYTLCVPMADAMSRAAAAGHTVRIMSNCYLPGPLMRRLLHGLKVPEAYDRVLFTADGGPKKPDPRAFRLIGKGVFERRVMVGDSAELDIEPARALGWDTVRVNPAHPDPARLLALLEL
ncbi:HAD family hydrolase [Streptomyces sp. H27-G5]|uniref:HAD family hydrolase n=1 Tax=Streptomyces sp. H27-G5 TaxID=2996698 RepID=UPI00226E2B2E|nr:HAD family hydrolase [Streptomyces sp. H27-G5]MCY0919407.1 HAD family hydrolase [Streptomyces sp. H27-G5]